MTKNNNMKNSLTFKFVSTFILCLLSTIFVNLTYAQSNFSVTNGTVANGKVELFKNDSQVREVFDETKTNRTNVEVMTSMFKLDKGNELSIIWSKICEERSEQINEFTVETKSEYSMILREFLEGRIKESYIDDLISNSEVNSENRGVEASALTNEQPKGFQDRDNNSFKTSGNSGITPYIPNNSRSEEFLKNHPNEVH